MKKLAQKLLSAVLVVLGFSSCSCVQPKLYGPPPAYEQPDTSDTPAIEPTDTNTNNITVQ